MLWYTAQVRAPYYLNLPCGSPFSISNDQGCLRWWPFAFSAKHMCSLLCPKNFFLGRKWGCHLFPFHWAVSWIQDILNKRYIPFFQGFKKMFRIKNLVRNFTGQALVAWLCLVTNKSYSINLGFQFTNEVFKILLWNLVTVNFHPSPWWKEIKLEVPLVPKDQNYDSADCSTFVKGEKASSEQAI